MDELFLKLINMSLSASWIVLAVLILRLLLKKAPKWVCVLLWGIVAVRLICPFALESALSLIPSTESVPLNIAMDWAPAIDGGIGVVDRIVNPIISSSFTPNPVYSANPLQVWIPLAASLWIAGMVLMLLYTAISYWRLRCKITTAVLYKENIFQSENVSSPFVLGLVRPKIYLPFKLNGNDIEHVIAHEQAHIHRKDIWWKPLGFLLLTIHWINPLMWIAYVLLCRDIELACDERVIKELNHEQRADYTQALVSCSINHRTIAACPLAFGEVGVKARVKSVMNYRKPTFWIIILAVVACVGVAVCFLTDPIDTAPDLSFLNYKNAISLVADRDEVPAIYCPSSDDGSDSSIQLGVALGSDFAKQLDRWEWTECDAPRQSLPTPGSVEFIIEDNYRIIVHQRKSGALRQYAVVKYQGEVRYYKIDQSDYPDAVDLVTAPAIKNKTMQAIVIEIRNGYFLTEPVEGSWELNSADRIEVPMRNMDPALEPQIGDTIEVTYDGEILETYPARIKEVSSLRVIEEVLFAVCYMGNDGTNVIMNPNYYEGRIDRDDSTLIRHEVNNSGKLVFTANWDTEELIVGEDYYERTGHDSVMIWQNTYHLNRNADGNFMLDVVCKNPGKGEKAIYYIPYDAGKYVLKVTFGNSNETMSSESDVSENFTKYFLTIGADDVKSIEFSLPDSGGGAQHADGSLLQKGERIWLEGLDGCSDLRGLTISAVNQQGGIVWSASIPDTVENKGFTHLKTDDWEITNIE